MTLVKVIDSTTWAGLTELDISESDDLSASLANDTYRLIHSATTALVVAAVALVSGAPAAISMTAYAATVETPSAAVTVTSASPAAISMTAYAADVSVSGGASGNFTFTQAQSNGSMAGSDPKTFSMLGAITAGNKLFAICGMRGDRAHANFAVTDNNGKTWTKRVGIDNELADGNARCALAIFERTVDASGETDTTPAITFDDNAVDGGTTQFKFMEVIEVQPSAAFGWVYKNAWGAGAGTGEWDTASPGSQSISGDDIFVLAVGMGRLGTANATEGGTAFGTYTTGKNFRQGADNNMIVVSSFSGTSVAAGSITDTLTSDSTGCEGGVMLIAFGDS